MWHLFLKILLNYFHEKNFFQSDQLGENNKVCTDACFQVKDQEEKITELEVENKQHEAQLMSLQQNRPKTAMQRPKTPQVGHKWPQNTTSRSQLT